jgi:hypothetical protein
MHDLRSAQKFLCEMGNDVLWPIPQFERSDFLLARRNLIEAENLVNLAQTRMQKEIEEEK